MDYGLWMAMAPPHPFYVFSFFFFISKIKWIFVFGKLFRAINSVGVGPDGCPLTMMDSRLDGDHLFCCSHHFYCSILCFIYIYIQG